MKTTLILSLLTLSSPVKADDEKDFRREVPFQVMDAELKLKKAGIAYNLEKGSRLSLGDVVFDDHSFVAAIENENLIFKWDPRLIESGEINVVNKRGEELWKVPAQGRGSWSFSQLNSDQAPRLKDREVLRFCIRAQKSAGYTSLCSQWYGLNVKGGKSELLTISGDEAPQVLIQNEEPSKDDFYPVEAGQPVQFFARLKSGTTYEFVSVMEALDIKDMVVAEKPNMVVLTGGGLKPLGEQIQVVDPNSYGKVTRFLGFEKTIAEPEVLWRAEVGMPLAKLDRPGTAGGVFTHFFEIQNPPKPEQRLFISERALTGTYSAQDEVTFVNAQGELGKWVFSADQMFASNRVTREIADEKGPHKAYLEVYRAASREVSVRLTGALTTEGNYGLLGEGHFGWWFNDIFGSQNYYLSKQRWGVTGRFFSSLKDIPTNRGGDVQLHSTELELRYRFTPGLWGRDESFGALAAYESLSIGELAAPMLGAGVFWSRSMPRSVDQFLNKLSIFQYPKWVSVDLISYISSLDSDYSLSRNYAVNFGGKMMLKPDFFVDGALGLKESTLDRKSDGAGVTLTTFYGSLGVGIDF